MKTYTIQWYLHTQALDSQKYHHIFYDICLIQYACIPSAFEHVFYKSVCSVIVWTL